MSDFDDMDDLVLRTARSSLLWGAAASIVLGFLQYCCNPVFVVTFLALGASLNSLRLPGQFKISLDKEDQPHTAMALSYAAGAIGLALSLLRLALAALQIAGFAMVSALQ